MEKNKLTTTSLEVLIDKHIGKVGTEKRDAFEHELQLDIIRSNNQKRQKRKKSNSRTTWKLDWS